MSWLASASLTHRLQGMAGGHGLRAQLIRVGLGSAGIQVISRVLSLATGVVLARALGADGYGVYAYAFALMSLLMVAAEAGVPTLLMREVAASQGRGDWGLLRGALIRAGQLVALAALMVSVSGLAVLWFMADRLSTTELYTSGLMLLLLPLVALSRTVAHAMYGLRHIVVGRVVEMLLRPALLLVSVGGLFLVYPGLRQPQYAMAAQLGVSAVVLLFGFGVLRRFLPPQTRNTPVQYRSRVWLKSTLPFTLIGGAGIINYQTDIIMLGWFTSSKDVGVYQVAVQGAMLVAVLSERLVGGIAAPYMAQLYARGDMSRLQHLVTQGARVALLAASPVALALVVSGGTLAGWVFGKDFTASHLPLAILAAGQLAGVATGMVGYLLNMTGNERITARTLWQTAILNVALNAILIPIFGTVGAAVATAISFISLNLALLKAVWDRLGINSSVFTLTGLGRKSHL